MNNLSDNVINKEAGNTNEVSKAGEDLMSLSLFNSDPYFNFVYKKAERLCLAIYLMTDFFPVGDPIKDSLRKSGTKLINVALSLITSSSSFRKEILNNISCLCLEIISLSKVSSNIGMTSVPNHNVLEGEIKNFIYVIEEREKPNTTGQGFVLNEDESVFGDLAKRTTSMFPRESGDKGFKEGLEDNKYNKEKEWDEEGKKDKDEKGYARENRENRDNRENREKDGKVNIKGVLERSVKGTTSNVGVGAGKTVMQKNERQQIILEIIREIGESSIKDISDNIKDCSEKTIQRELNTLIYNGSLKKIGERRWSKYVLA